MAIALREFWQVRGHWREAQRWLDLSLQQADYLPLKLRGKLEHAAGVISAMRRDYGRAFPISRRRSRRFATPASPHTLQMRFSI